MKTKARKYLLLCALMVFALACSVVSVSAKGTARQKALEAYSKKLSASKFKPASKIAPYDSADLKFAIVDLNKDNIPELIVLIRQKTFWGSRACTYFYTWVNGKIKYIGTPISDSDLYSRWKISSKTGALYAVKGNTQQLLHMNGKTKVEYLDKQTYHGKPSYFLSHNMITGMGKTIGKSQFNSLKQKWVGNSTLKKVKYYTNTPGNRKKYMK